MASRWTRRIRGRFILGTPDPRGTGAANTIRAPRRRRRSLRLSEIINATLDKLIFISDILANYEMQLFSRPAAGFNVAPRRCRFVADDDHDDGDDGGCDAAGRRVASCACGRTIVIVVTNDPSFCTCVKKLSSGNRSLDYFLFSRINNT